MLMPVLNAILFIMNKISFNKDININYIFNN